MVAVILVPFFALLYWGCEINIFVAIKIYEATLSWLLCLIYLYVGRRFYSTLGYIYGNTFGLIRRRTIFVVVL